jgi:hypothetical protein
MIHFLADRFAGKSAVELTKQRTVAKGKFLAKPAPFGGVFVTGQLRGIETTPG